MITEIDNDILVRFVTGQCSDDELSAVSQWARQSRDNARELFELEMAYREAQAAQLPPAHIDDALRRVHGITDMQIL